MAQRGTEMFFADVDPDEASPDLGLWAEFLDADELEELQGLSDRLREERLAQEADEAFRTAASSLGIPYKGGTPAYHKAYNALKAKAKEMNVPVGTLSWSTHAPANFAPNPVASANPGGAGAGAGAGVSAAGGTAASVLTPPVTLGTFTLAPGVVKLPGQMPLTGNIPAGHVIHDIIFLGHGPGGSTGDVLVTHSAPSAHPSTWTVTPLIKPAPAAPAPAAPAPAAVPAGSVPFDSAKLPAGATVTGVTEGGWSGNIISFTAATGVPGQLHVPKAVAAPAVGTHNPLPAGLVPSPFFNIEATSLPIVKAHATTSIALLTGGEKTTFRAYTGEGFRQINGNIHKGNYDAFVAAGKPASMGTPAQKTAYARTATLETAFSKVPNFPQPINVFRGTSHNPLPAGAVPGAEFKLKGFSSTSIREGGAFGGVYHVHIKTHKGLFVKTLSTHASEDEVLLPHNVKVRYIGTEKRLLLNGVTRNVIMLETHD